jgi:hypothetical protein
VKAVRTFAICFDLVFFCSIDLDIKSCDWYLLRTQILRASNLIFSRDGDEKELILGKADRERRKAFVLNAIPDLLTSP